MAIRTRTAPSFADSPDPAPEPAPLADELEIVDDDEITEKESHPAAVIVKAREFTKAATTELDRTLHEGTPEQCCDAYLKVTQLFTARMNMDPTLRKVAQTQNADVLLDPAIQSIRQTEALIRREAPSALRLEDMTQVKQAENNVAHGRRVLRILEPLFFGATAVRNQGQQSLNGFARRVYVSVAPEMERHFTLQRDLIPLEALVKQPSTLAQESKKSNAKLVTKTEAVTIERVMQGLTPPPPPAPPQSTPGQPPANPPPLPLKKPDPSPKKRP